MSLLASFQRDINKLVDSDRNVRKKGLLKLYEELPWQIKQTNQQQELSKVISLILPALTNIISESVEKCRELALKILLKICESHDNNTEIMSILAPACKRINDVPFPEPAEELRLLVVGIVTSVMSKVSECESEQLKEVFHTLTISLSDSFPAVKVEAAALLLSLVKRYPETVRMNYKSLLKGLLANIFHQHSKVRVVTIKAFGICLSVVQDDYAVVMQEHLPHTLLFRILTDHSALVRLAFTDMLQNILQSHVHLSDEASVSINVEVACMLLLLMADETQEVRSTATSSLDSSVLRWKVTGERRGCLPHEGDDIEDAEVELHRASAELIEADTSLLPNGSAKAYVTNYINVFAKSFVEGISGWTSTSRQLYLRGLEVCCDVVEADITAILHQLIPSLSSALLDDEPASRIAAERVSSALGRHISSATILEQVVPYMDGSMAGHDTAFARASGTRLNQHVLSGHLPRSLHDEMLSALIEAVASRIGDLSMHQFREVFLRESLLLMARELVSCISLSVTSEAAEHDVVTALVLLMGRVHGESENIVMESAVKELRTLAAAKGAKDSAALLDAHFDRILERVCCEAVMVWDGSSLQKSIFEVLLRECTLSAWRLHVKTIDIIRKMAVPKPKPVPGSPEELSLSYASIRGEEVAVISADVEIRLQLLAALEDLVRKGSALWEASAYIADASESIILHILIPNMVWRSGRVEATVRKVALATCYGVLKAGATSTETLFKVAPSLVPLIVSSLEDTHSDVSPRYMACFCLTVVFDRLKGSFGEQTLKEIYHMLLKRLDDSDDSVRMAICGTLQAFFLCAPPNEYSGTLIDYSLDQLFIHLDDGNPDIQDAVFKVLIEAAIKVDKQLVRKKAESSKLSHRSPHLCDKVILATEDD